MWPHLLTNVEFYPQHPRPKRKRKKCPVHELL